MTIQEPDTSRADERPVVSRLGVDIVVSLLLLAVAVLLGWDSWRVGNAWADDGPQAGYFPFYLALLMGTASVFGLASAIASRGVTRETFVTRAQLSRVLQVFVPTFAFCLLTQFFGLYVASFLLVAGFMWGIGRLPAWVSFATSLIFTVAMFATFEIAFNVIMPKGPLEAALGF